MSNRPTMATQGPEDPVLPAPDRLQAVAQRAARVQDLLLNMEVALLASGDKDGLRVLGGLKRAWREFRDEAMRAGPSGGPLSGSPGAWYLRKGVCLVISWVAVVIGAAFVPVGLHVRGHIVRHWGEPAALRSWWGRAVFIAAVVVSLGVPAMNRHVALAPFYGLGLGLLGPRPRRLAARA